jgi:hypothetical protein
MERRKLDPADKVKAMRARRDKVAEAERMRTAARERVLRQREAAKRAKELGDVAGDAADGVGAGTPAVEIRWIDQMVNRVGCLLRNGEVERAIEVCREVANKGVDFDPLRAESFELDSMRGEVFGGLGRKLEDRGVMTVRQLLMLTIEQLTALVGERVANRLQEIMRTKYTESDGRLLNYPGGYRSRETKPADYQRKINKKFNRWD